MLNKITDIINEWAPIDVFPYAPKDEYINEINELVAYIESVKNCSVDTLGNKIYELFIRTLGDDVFMQSIDDCGDIAKKILA